MFFPFDLAAVVRRGDKEREAMDMGDGSTICTSDGDPSHSVRDRLKGVREVFFDPRDACALGEPTDSPVRSVVEGKSLSSFVLTEESGMSS